MKELYDMKLHDLMKPYPWIDVTRVPGGWIYTTTFNEATSQCFVPFNREFDEEYQTEMYGKKGGSK